MASYGGIDCTYPMQLLDKGSFWVDTIDSVMTRFEKSTEDRILLYVFDKVRLYKDGRARLSQHLGAQRAM